MINQLLWAQGICLDEYVNQMEVYQKQMLQRINNLYITSAEFDRFKNIKEPIKILVITEEWCKDSLMNLPIIAKISEASPNIELRIFDRAKFPELWKYFQDQGFVNIPICWMMNEDFSRVGVWVERPKKAYKMLEGWKRENPEVDRIKLNGSLSDDEKQLKLIPYMDQLLDEMWNWYDTELQSDTVKELFDQLKK